MTRRRWVLLAAAIVALLLLAGRVLATVYVEVQWYRAVGAIDVWNERIANTLLVWGVSALAGMIFVFVNLFAVRLSVVTLILPRRVANLEIGEEVPGRLMTTITVLASALLGMALAMPADTWQLVALARHGRPFGDAVPYLELDPSFFVYWIPLERAAYEWALLTVIVAGAIVVCLYALTPSLRWQNGAFRVSTRVRRHLSLLGATVLLLLAWSHRLDGFDAFVHGSGPQGFVTPADRAVAIQLAPVLTAIASMAAILVAFSGWRGQVRVVLAALTIVLANSVVIRRAFPTLAHRLTPPEEWAAFDTAALVNRAIFSRRAFGADAIAAQPGRILFATGTDAIPWVSVWDPHVLSHAVRPADGTGPPVGDFGWWIERGALTVALIEPPADLADRPGAAWTVARVENSVESIREPPGIATDAGPIVVRQTVLPTLVYPGAGDPLIVGDSTARIAAAAAEGLVSRIAHAWTDQQPRLLGEVRPAHPRILRVRDVFARVRGVAPFLTPGTASVPVLSGDTIMWAVDLYAASADYPFSVRLPVAGEERSYFHHAATALINGRTGHVTLVKDSVVEAIAATWISRFPGLFVDWSDIPPAVSSALPPALDGVRAAATVFAMFGERGSGSRAPGYLAPGLIDSAFTSNAALIGLPGVRPTTAWVWPVLDAAANVRGIVVARGGRDHAMTWHPVDVVEARWHTWLERLGSAVDSAAAARIPDLTSGATRALPLGSGFALYRSWYTKGSGGATVVYRAAIATSDTVRSGTTLAEALGGTATPTMGIALPDERARLTALYDRMRAALRRGDWVAFGAAMDSLGLLLGRRGR